MASSKNLGNQKRLKYQKRKVDCSKDLFILEHMESINQALYCLRSSAGFKLFIYLAKNNLPKEEWWELSSKDFMAKSGFARTAYDTAVAELVYFGYLKQIGQENDYIFTDYLNLNQAQLDERIEGFAKATKEKNKKKKSSL